MQNRSSFRIRTGAGNETLLVPSVQQLNVLGDVIDAKGCSVTSVEHSLQAEKARCAKKDLFDSKGGRVLKLKAWARHVQPVILHAAGSWEFTSSLLDRIRSWELSQNRNILKQNMYAVDKRGNVESPWMHKHRTSKIIYRLAGLAGIRMSFQLAVLRVFNEAYKNGGTHRLAGIRPGTSEQQGHVSGGKESMTCPHRKGKQVSRNTDAEGRSGCGKIHWWQALAPTGD